MRNLIAPAVLLASLTTAPGVFAQTTTTTTTTANGSASGQANVGVSLPGATTTTTTTAVPGGSDHNQMVGRLAVGYFGISNIGAGANVAANGMALNLGSNDSPYAVTGTAPVVGVRYWIDQMIGVDVGVGMTIVGGGGKVEASGNGANASASASRLPFTGFILHGGVPLALASVDYFTFEVIPELNVGFAHSRQAAGPGLSSSGFHFDLGGRVGGEVSFGFMHIPQLSLVGSVGLRFDTDSGSTSAEAGGLTTKASTSRSEFHTTVGPNPWAIFVNQVAALYYF